MKPLVVVLCLACWGLAACGPVYDDLGAPDPRSWWPWVCADGGTAPDTGCLSTPISSPPCAGGESAEAGDDDGC